MAAESNTAATHNLNFVLGACLMANETPQTYANHTRWDPPFHFFVGPALIITVIGMIVAAVRHPNVHSAWMVVVAVALLILAFKTRLYALKVQERVIRLEERLRLSTLLAEPLRSRIGELTESQLIALRFASDAETPALVEATLANNWSRSEIKKQIKNWRPDEFRV
jgi:Na+/melibiose symporter-like transporter